MTGEMCGLHAIEMSSSLRPRKTQRDTLKVLHTVQQAQRTQAEAARRLPRSTRQVRRLLRKLRAVQRRITPGASCS
jgi:transcriptional regulator with GAF, ATPase, and Fis domain